MHVKGRPGGVFGQLMAELMVCNPMIICQNYELNNRIAMLPTIYIYIPIRSRATNYILVSVGILTCD